LPSHDVETRILGALLENETLSFRKLQEITQVSPCVLKKSLSFLGELKVIDEIGRNAWRRGKKLNYKLTMNGKRRVCKKAIDDLNGTLAMVSRILESMHQSKTGTNARDLLLASVRESFQENQPLDLPAMPPRGEGPDPDWQAFIARWHRYRKAKDKAIGPLTRSFRLMVRLMLEVSISDSTSNEIRKRALQAVMTNHLIQIILPESGFGIEIKI